VDPEEEEEEEAAAGAVADMAANGRHDSKRQTLEQWQTETTDGNGSNGSNGKHGMQCVV
jgi:hypothetical protein